ncbi:unnamed protein product [Malus baccata var. baccata]
MGWEKGGSKWVKHHFIEKRWNCIHGPHGMPELFSLKINHGRKWSESAYTGGIPGMSYCEGLRLIERDQDVGVMCQYVPEVREIEMYLEHLSPKQAALKHKLLMNLDKSAILKKKKMSL